MAAGMEMRSAVTPGAILGLLACAGPRIWGREGAWHCRGPQEARINPPEGHKAVVIFGGGPTWGGGHQEFQVFVPPGASAQHGSLCPGEGYEPHVNASVLSKKSL